MWHICNWIWFNRTPRFIASNKKIRSLSRYSNLRYKEVEIPQRLDVHLLDISTGHYSGGGIISLDHHVSGALTTIFNNSCHFTYLFSFSFLRRAIRMEFTSSNLRKQWFCATCLSYDPQIDLPSVIHLFVAEIRYFIHQLQYYISFGYSKCVWENLVKRVYFTQDLNNAITAQQAFLGMNFVFPRCT